MKSSTVCLFAYSVFQLLLSLPAHSQLAFEEVKPPVDMSIRILRKSPIGEYFLQLANDYEGLYRSSNGKDWTRDYVPNLNVEEIQFYNDGTPLIHSSGKNDFIRRNGIWNPLQTDTAWRNTHISFDACIAR